MKTKIIVIALFALIVCCCKPLAYLPDYDAVGINQYGSKINVRTLSGSAITSTRGELIAIDSSKLIVLREVTNAKKTEKEAVCIPLDEVKQFNLQYAKSTKLAWLIPVFGLASAALGYYAVAAIPINLAVTISASSGKINFSYSDKNMTFEKLRMFARFPQGIPPGIDLAAID